MRTQLMWLARTERNNTPEKEPGCFRTPTKKDALVDSCFATSLYYALFPTPFGQVAQLVERGPEKAGVGGSIPSLATNLFNNLTSFRNRVKISRAHNTRPLVNSNFTFDVGDWVWRDLMDLVKGAEASHTLIASHKNPREMRCLTLYGSAVSSRYVQLH